MDQLSPHIALLNRDQEDEAPIFYHPQTGTWGVNQLQLLFLSKMLVKKTQSTLTINDTMKNLISSVTILARLNGNEFTPNTSHYYIPFLNGIWSFATQRLLDVTDPVVSAMHLRDEQIIRTEVPEAANDQYEQLAEKLIAPIGNAEQRTQFLNILATILFEQDGHQPINISCPSTDFIHKWVDFLDDLLITPICKITLDDFNDPNATWPYFETDTKLLLVTMPEDDNVLSETGMVRYRQLMDQQLVVTNGRYQQVDNSPRLIISGRYPLCFHSLDCESQMATQSVQITDFDEQEDSEVPEDLISEVLPYVVQLLIKNYVPKGLISTPQ